MNQVEVDERSFFFKAEDGIRDSVASRGLGDEYKKQYQERNGSAKIVQRFISGGTDQQKAACAVNPILGYSGLSVAERVCKKSSAVYQLRNGPAKRTGRYTFCLSD